MALGDFASLAEPRRPHPALRRRAERHPRRRHDVAAVGADAGGDLRPRPGPRLRRDDRRRGARQGLQLVAGAGDGHRAHAAGGAPAREPRRGPVPGGRDGGPGGRRRQEPPRDRDAQALRRQQRGVGPHRLQHPDRAQRQRERHRLRARAAGDLRGAVQARHPRVHGRRGDVLLQPPQRAADVREPGAALRPQGLGLRRLRGPRLHLRRQGPAGRDARRPRRPRPRRAGRAHGRHVHLGPGAGRAAGRHRPAHALRDVRLGRLRRPARAGGRERQHAGAPGAGDEGVGGRHGAARERPPRAAAGRARAALDRGHRPLGRRRGLHQRRLVGRDAGARRRPSRRWPGSARGPGPA